MCQGSRVFCNSCKEYMFTNNTSHIEPCNHYEDCEDEEFKHISYVDVYVGLCYKCEKEKIKKEKEKNE